ncbi:ABC transporter ATP-binding protein [Tepidibacter thalassicus]|uniref:ABC-type multidrug transport system, ATPase component n=1 Tax=Tepidibacter thalassicus DSM 15285 TaxID=1123350 RepID=A0A1M5SE06_9FIRM|nr:ABC transporter ATP-binding protein [Tepidibacter thalassicus]SHH36784.1 ABC-type multidrug transport system, ATPase component [Tepidibacter thalassicus DSM 15285]
MNEIIKVKNLSKKIKKRTIINNVSFSIEKGDICGFIGPNGSGKTTIMRLLTNLITPTSGEIYLNNINVNKNRKKALQNIGAIVETPVFFPYFTGEKALLNLVMLTNLNSKDRKKQVKKVLKIVNLQDQSKYKISTYSLGMKQRLGIAQALLNNPKIILLDEPSNGLDPIGIIELRKLILKLNKENNITFFISSHLLDELQKICNKILIIKKGELIWNGKSKDLFNSHTNLEKVFVNLINS